LAARRATRARACRPHRLRHGEILKNIARPRSLLRYEIAAFYGEQFLEYIVGPKVVVPYRWVYCLLIPLGAITKVELVWAWGDLMNALQVLPNIVGVLGLSGLVAKVAVDRQSSIVNRQS